MARDRDLALDAMLESARQMTDSYGFEVSVGWHDPPGFRTGFRKVQGFATPVGFEPVRERWLLGRRWRELQRVDTAASRTGKLLAAASATCNECGHPTGYHPGFIRVTACAICIAAEDRGEIEWDQMCRKEIARPQVAA
jgi:hypothetical protein